MTRVLVAGASGRTGRHVLRYLRGTDHRVVATTRDADAADPLRTAGANEVRVGDLLDGDADALVEGCGGVISTVGSGPSVRALTGEIADGAGIAALADAAERAGVRTFVLTSSIGVGDSKSGMPLPVRALLWPVLRAKARGEAAVRDTAFDGVVVRPGGLTGAGPGGDLVVAEGGDTVGGSVSRSNVARLLVAALDTPEAAGRTFEVVARDGLRGDASGEVDVPWRWPDAA